MGKNSSWREQRINIAISEVREINFNDTIPNYIYVANNSAYALYMAISPMVSDTLFDMIIPAYATKLYAREEGTRQVYIANKSLIGTAAITVLSFSGDFDARALPQTQEIVGASSAGLIGVVDINSFIASLPAGAAHIGAVAIDLPIPAGAAHIGAVEIDLPLPAGLNNIGKVTVSGELPGGTQKIGGVDIASALPAGTNKVGKISIDADATDNGGLVHRLVSAATTNATSVKGSAGRIAWGRIDNLTAAVKFVKFYNSAVAPVVGTDIPILTFTIKANDGIELSPAMGIYFGLGIAYAITGAVADADTTAVALNDVVVNLIYK